MKGVPPEIDALMWSLAEDGGPAAQAEFEARHTRYGPELSRRIRMVAELRQAGKAVAHRPAFTPRPARVVPTPRWAIGTVVGMAVLAIGAVAYVATSSSRQPVVVGKSPPPVVPSVVAPPSDPTPEIPKPETPEATPPPQDPTPQPQPTYLTPREVKIEDTNLTAAIMLVATGGGLKATIAPGFQDRKVTFDYPGLSTIDALRAMGEEFGFTVLEEEEGRVLVVPVRESSDRTPRIGG